MSTPVQAGPNFAEIEAIFEHIDKHPEEWYQGLFGKAIDCGTAFCVAGHAVVRAGWTTKLNVYGDVEFYKGKTRQSSNEIAGRAAELLGLNFDQGDALFAATNSRSDLAALVEQIRIDPAGEDTATLEYIVESHNGEDDEDES